MDSNHHLFWISCVEGKDPTAVLSVRTSWKFFFNFGGLEGGWEHPAVLRVYSRFTYSCPLRSGINLGRQYAKKIPELLNDLSDQRFSFISHLWYIGACHGTVNIFEESRKGKWRRGRGQCDSTSGRASAFALHLTDQDSTSSISYDPPSSIRGSDFWAQSQK